ncbi:hypothetical protein PV08_09800 [Exophiala spinifera]|uniref:H/ACA ribonucleoprotein complex non-core subunit NAF1 n=1 Tax=Exophiala spinifera TaxID=91928 RepID=A0A0D2B0W8_9EURO|nr:uncharacterized protein PV08_09800 [Exophiala spinifera]KIW12523.1 hypothetical protein PV08_09800 [Exophiala spinifera]
MDVDDFPTSPSKRQRTASPDETRPLSHDANPDSEGDSLTVQTSTENASAIPGLAQFEEQAPETQNTSKDANSLLDALMLQVEAEADSSSAMHLPPSSAQRVVTTTEEQKTAQGVPVTVGVEVPQAAVQNDPTDTPITRTESISASATQGTSDTPMTQDTVTHDAVMSVNPDTNVVIPIVANTAGAPAAPTVSENSTDTATAEESQPPETAADGAEWEIDSSPYESSSDSDSSDDTTSSDEDSDEDADGEYSMLDPEEAARLLMQEDGGSDDEGGRSRDKSDGAQLRTANERQEEVIPKPDIIVTNDMKIEELGNVEFVVESTVVIKAKTSGEYQVLEPGSLITLEDRSVVGVVADLIGRVEEPRYTIRFTNDEAIAEAGLSHPGTVVFYVPQHSTFVFTQPLKGLKGSDASNFHDEEVGDDEMEFSDDEAEAEHKRQMKARKQGRGGDSGRGRGGSKFARGSSNRAGRGAHSHQPTDNNGYGNGSMQMNYDDVPDAGDEGYTPLQRPDHMAEALSRGEQPQENTHGYHLPPPPPVQNGRADFGGRGRGHSRGRGAPRGHRGGGFNHSRGGGGFNHQQHNSYTNTQGGYRANAPDLRLPTTPSITPHNISYPPTTPSPMTPLPNVSFNFGGMQAPAGVPFMPQMPVGMVPSFFPQFQQPQQPFQQQQFQPPAQNQQGFAPGTSESKSTSQPLYNSGPWASNPALAAALQRYAEEQRRTQGS